MEQLLVGKLGREDVENGRLGGIEAVRDELRSRDEKVELGKMLTVSLDVSLSSSSLASAPTGRSDISESGLPCDSSKLSRFDIRCF